MRDAGVLAPVALAVLLTVTAVAWWVGGPADTAPLAATVGEAGARSSARAGHDHLPPLAPDGGLTSADLWAEINDPANSDLPPDVFREVASLAADVVRADATDEGRDRWPDYWAGEAGRAVPCCTRIVVHAASSLRDPSNPAQVHAVVIWSGLLETEEVLTERIATLSFERLADGNWRPVR